MLTIDKRSSRLPAAALASATIVAGCVQDYAVEDEVLPPRGAFQPREGGAETVDRATACEALATAEDDARQRLHCDTTDHAPCPQYLSVAGALPCSELKAASVDACVAEIGDYSRCSDFDDHPCIVTVVTDSCVAPARSEAGADAAADGAPDASPADAAGLDAAAADASADGADASTDGAGDAAAEDAQADAAEAGAGDAADGASDATTD